MRITAVLTVIFWAGLPVQAQLTREQKIEDFQTMANQFAKRYVAASLKTTLFGVDILDINPFLDRVAVSKDDLEFYDICVDYTAQFRDGGHVFFGIPSNFTADLNFRVDTYDGKPLVYSINRAVLPASRFPFQIGDELVSIDGKSSADLMASFYKYGIISNERTGVGYAAQALTFRPQSAIPHAIDVPDTSTVVIRRQSGDLETYVIPWTKTGVPLVNAGPVPSPSSTPRPASKEPADSADAEDNAGDSAAPLYSMLPSTRAVAGVGSLLPVFSPPAGFKMRLGRNANTDAFFSGTYPSNGYTIGFIRIPSFSPAVGVPTALAQFDAEISFFRDNTDGLIVDDMRNPGGLVYYGEEIARHLTPRPIRFIGFELRSTREFVNTFSAYVQRAQGLQMPQYVIDFYSFWLDAVEVAYSQNGGHTGPVPLDTIFLNPPVVPALDEEPLDTSGNPVGYSKPIIVLTDEFSFSGADYFPATMQDNNAATIFGMRTSGLGGTNASYNAGAYSEAVIGMLRGLMVRKNPISVAGFPTNNYIENVGVQPDIVEDYKTLDNLLNGGKTFVDHFTAAMVNLIQQKK